jgi:hypothetical protein
MDDWCQDLPALLDEQDLSQWMEGEMLEAFESFLQFAFRKMKTRADAMEILRGIVWEFYLFQRSAKLHSLPGATPKTEETVKRLLNLPQTAQKTGAWYAEARELLTGHEFGGVVLGTPTGIQSLVAKKCGAEMVVAEEDTNVESRIVYVTPEDGKLSPFQWGWRYESVIRTLFEQEVAKGRVDDSLGRIRHPTLPRLAASPDGIVLEGPKQGRLVEIKAPFSRELTGVLPEEYYCQIQLQAEVADVDAVEYIEVRFDAKPATSISVDQFLKPSAQEEIPQRIGCILVIAPHADAPPETWKYEYSPIFTKSLEHLATLLTWTPDSMPTDAVVLERSVWRIQDWWTQTIPRNRRWWNEVGKPAYESFWKQVDHARFHGLHKSRGLLLIDSESDRGSDTASVGKKSVSGCLIASDSENEC